ncbi:MAG: DUF4832 domain-containing protein [Candidatus Acidiferrales bacterium]
MTIPMLIAAMAISISPLFAQETTAAASSENGKAQATSSASVSARVMSLAAPQCATTEQHDEITITCDYTSTPRSVSNGESEPRIVLNRAVLAFKTHEENMMRVELTLTNEGKTSVSEARAVYLAIDDDAGKNYVRRLLPNVDFRELAPGKRVTFSDRLRIGRFLAGHYTFHLWIPSRNPSLEFNPAHNLLISSAGVPDPRTGLNTLAAFAVER